ncbi:MAG TPA: NADH-quinone oxidoreductase subunit M [Verrucomicrobiales bacterium]|nr:NADH-quinone oxidoreductase subunit M [Verrucomicrobiales bacterium]
MGTLPRWNGRGNTNDISSALSPLDLLIFLPILAAVAMAFGAPARTTAIGAATLNLVIGLWLASVFNYGEAGYQFANKVARTVLVSPEMAFSVGIDGMGLVMVLLTVIVTFAAVWVKPAKQGSEGMYYASSLLIAAGAMGAFVARDLVFFFAFHELALIPTFLMIGMRGTGNHKEAAWKITVYLGLGSLVVLAGLAWLVVAAAKGGAMTFDMEKLRTAAGSIDAGTQEHIYLVLLLGFGVLISLFPFHSWAAPAYAAAPAPVTMLHAGVLKKFGLYGLLRVAVPMLPLGHSAEWIQHLLIVLLLGNILFIGLVTIAQRELDMTLANSSVMHMGYIFLGIVSGTDIGYAGAILLMFAHGVSIALLFALSTAVKQQTGTLQYHRLGGLAKTAPFMGLMFGMAAFASIGLPGFANFAGEVNIFFGGFANKPAHCLGWTQWATIFALWGVVMSAVYMLRAYRAVFKGEPSPVSAGAADMDSVSRLPVLTLVAALLVVGFFPGTLLKAINPVVKTLAPASR